MIKEARTSLVFRGTLLRKVQNAACARFVNEDNPNTYNSSQFLQTPALSFPYDYSMPALAIALHLLYRVARCESVFSKNGIEKEA